MGIVEEVAMPRTLQEAFCLMCKERPTEVAQLLVHFVENRVHPAVLAFELGRLSYPYVIAEGR